MSNYVITNPSRIQVQDIMRRLKAQRFTSNSNKLDFLGKEYTEQLTELCNLTTIDPVKFLQVMIDLFYKNRKVLTAKNLIRGVSFTLSPNHIGLYYDINKAYNNDVELTYEEAFHIGKRIKKIGNILEGKEKRLKKFDNDLEKLQMDLDHSENRIPSLLSQLEVEKKNLESLKSKKSNLENRKASFESVNSLESMIRVIE
jgi:hypothetical protein